MGQNSVDKPMWLKAKYQLMNLNFSTVMTLMVQQGVCNQSVSMTNRFVYESGLYQLSAYQEKVNGTHAH